MPGCVTHLIVAQQLLNNSNETAWGGSRESEAWFLLGANAPDCGVYPGGIPLLTDLSHYVMSADLVRTMIEMAETPQDRSFSLGWLSHVVADSIMHPLVNREVGRRLGLNRAANYFQDPVMHIKVELGFDANAYDALRLPFPRLSEESLTSTSAFLNRAYCVTYKRQFNNAMFNASLLALNRYVTWMIAVARLNRNCHRSGISLSRCVLMSLRALSPLIRIGSEARAIFQTIAPSATFLQEMRDGIASTILEYRRQLQNDLKQLQNYNLDTGELSTSEDSYTPAVEAKLRLAEYHLE